MAITAETRTAIVQLVVTAYDAAPGTTLLTELVTLVDEGGSLADVAANLTTRTEWTSKYPSFQTAGEFGAEWLGALVPEASADALAAGIVTVEGLIAGGSTFADIIIAAQGYLAALPITDATFGTSAGNFANKVTVATYQTITLEEAGAGSLAGVTSDVATVATTNTAAAAAANPVASTTVALTTGADAIAGDSSNNTITAASGTLTSGDTISGGDGIDTLNATILGVAPAQSATSLTGVEVLNLTASPNPASIALTGVTGVTDINNVNSANGASLSVSGVGAPVSSSISGSSATTIAYTAAVTGATAITDAATLTLNGVTAGSSYTATGVDQLTINSTTSANTLTTLGVSSAATATIIGDQALTLGTVGGSKLTSLNAAEFTGSALTVTSGAGLGTAALAGVTISGPTAAETTSTITAGGNKDTITLGAGTNILLAGGGDDTITSGAGTNTITSGSGNDKITLNAGTDTLVYAEAGATDSDTITGFSSGTVFSLTLGKDAVAGKAGATANADFGIVQTSATKATIGNVDGAGTGTAIAFQVVTPNLVTANSVKIGTNVIALNSAFTDGTALGAVTALGTTATTAITTTATSKFLLVTYSVGNIAQIWSYNADTDAGADIDGAELDLMATLNGVTQGSLTAANFSTFVTPDVVATAAVAQGQQILLVGAKNDVTTTANANGQFLTAAADTVSVQIGSLPTAVSSATVGVSVFDATVGDGDVFNATVLNDAWNTGTTLANIETVNLTLSVADTGLVAGTTMPGTTAINFGGTQNQTGLTVGTGMAIGLTKGYVGSVTQTAALAALTLNLNGTAGATAATSPQFINTGAITALTVNVPSTSTLRGDGTQVFNATGTTLKGAGSLTIFDTAAALGAASIAGNDVTRTGSLTLRPSTNAAIDLSNTASKVTGVDTIDLSSISTFASTITLASDNQATNTTALKFGNLTATASGAYTVVSQGSGLSDTVNVSLGRAIATTGAVTATSIENFNVTSSALATGTLSLGNISLTNGVGTQVVKVTTAATLGGTPTITADTVDFTGVTGTVTALTLANTAGVGFTGGPLATNVTGSAAADVINTGAGNDVITDGGTAGDSISAGAGNDVIAAAGAAIDTLMNGGTGNDSYHFAAVPTAANTSAITDSAGTDTLVFANAAAADITGMNTGNDLGVERLVVNNVTSGLTVAPGQIGTLSITGSAVGGALGVTLGTAGALNMSAVTFTAVAAAAFLTNAGAASALTNAVTSTTLLGTATADTITGSSLADVITGGDGTDTVSGGGGIDQFAFAAGDQAGANGAAVADVITGFVVGTDNLQFTGIVDVVSVQQAAVQVAVTALAAGSTDAQIATAMANANTTNLGTSFATYNGNSYVYVETTGATATHVEADNVFVKLSGITTIPTFAADVVA